VLQINVRRHRCLQAQAPRVLRIMGAGTDACKQIMCADTDACKRRHSKYCK